MKCRIKCTVHNLHAANDLCLSIDLRVNETQANAKLFSVFFFLSSPPRVSSASLHHSIETKFILTCRWLLNFFGYSNDNRAPNNEPS